MNMTDTQAAIFRHWKSSANKHQGLPSRKDFGLKDLGHHAAHIVIMDIEYNPSDFVYRLIGSSVVENFQEDYTGKPLSLLPGKGPNSTIWACLEATAERREPLYKEVPYVGPNEKQDKLVSLYLPLATDHVIPDKILIVPGFPGKQTFNLFSSAHNQVGEPIAQL